MKSRTESIGSSFSQQIQGGQQIFFMNHLWASLNLREITRLLS
jgi:hypothetical protein